MGPSLLLCWGVVWVCVCSAGPAAGSGPGLSGVKQADIPGPAFWRTQALNSLEVGFGPSGRRLRAPVVSLRFSSLVANHVQPLGTLPCCRVSSVTLLPCLC